MDLNDAVSHLPQIIYWAIAILSVLLFGWILRRDRGNDRPRLPPGPPGLPILGNLHMLGDLPHRDLNRLSNKYGPIMYMRLGFAPTVVVSSPAAAEQFLKTHDLVFASRPKSQAAQLISYGCKAIAFTPYGPYWRTIRKICTIELLSNLKIELSRPIRKEELDQVIESLKDSAEAGTVVDVSEKVGTLIEEITYRMVFGKGKEYRLNIKPVIVEALTLIGAFNLADYIPYADVLDLQGFGRRLKAVSHALDETLEKIIDEHVRDAAKNLQEHHQDFIDVMLSLMMKSNDNQEEQVIDRTNIKAIMLDILAATMDTSATAIEWAMSELLKHPRVMKKLQDELESVVGMDRMVQETDLVKLKYLDMVVKECFRLHSVVPLLVPRESMEDITIDGYHIPKKCRVIVNAWAIGRNPEVWSDNADEFFPERFIGTNIDVRGCDFQLIPFGSGRRGCPAMQLGLTMVWLVVAQLVHCFHWELPYGMSPNELDMSEKYGLSLPRANHLLALPTYRLHIN